MNTAELLFGVLFSSLGFGFFLYGKKQRRPVPLVCGISLLCYPYFVDNIYVLVGIGVALVAAPIFWRTE